MNELEKPTTESCCKTDRRGWFDWIAWLILGGASVLMSLPLIGYLFGAVIWKKKDRWIVLGKVSQFKPDTTVFVYDLENGEIIEQDESIAYAWEFGPGQTSYDDLSANRGFDYYYFLEVLDDGSQNNVVPLKSSKFFTITNSPAFLKRPPGMLEEIRVVPNPYNIASRDMQYGVSAPDRLMFLNIPGECTIRIFSERGDLLKTIQHTDGSGDEAWNSITSSRQVITSGLYIAHFETPEGENAIRKFIVVR